MATLRLGQLLVLSSTVTTFCAGPLRSINLTHLGTYASGVFEQGAAEIAAYDAPTFRLFVVNAWAASVDVLDISDPTTPAKIATLALAPLGGVANSVAVRDGTLAVALEGFQKTDLGRVLFFDRDLNFITMVHVGAQPDMVTFSPNGRWVLTANEGEPNHYNPGNIDPLGTISIINVSEGAELVNQADVRTIDFTAYNAMALPGIRVFGPAASVAQDIEPEYIAVAQDSKTAWVTLQENNALAVVDIEDGVATGLIPLGLKNHSMAGQGLDPSDRDNAAGTGPAIRIGTWPVLGMYLPDSVAAYEAQGETFLVLANEGDAREYAGFEEEIRIGSAAYLLDPTTFPNAAALKQNRNLGRLRATLVNGDLDGDGDYDQIHTYGARSFSIRRTDGTLVYDSGDDFEQITALLYPTRFNASNNNNTLDNRSPAKGPEPEGVTVGKAYGRTYVFVGLERIGGVIAYDVTDPFGVTFATYVNNRNFAGTFSFATAGDLGPEGILFINEEESPVGMPLVVTANEVSGTTTIYAVTKEE